MPIRKISGNLSYAPRISLSLSIYIYIYVCVCVCVYVCVSKSCHFLLYMRDRQIMVSGWCSLLCEAFVLGEISFLILLSLVWKSNTFSVLTLKTSIFLEDSLGNKYSRLANQSQIISCVCVCVCKD